MKNDSKVPHHIAIIMDGNGRWAEKRGLPRNAGHMEGAKRVSEIVEGCLEIGVEYLSIYAFSKENWRRPREEVTGIMKLTEYFFKHQFRTLRDKGVYFVHLGEKKGLPDFVLRIINEIEKNNVENPKMYLCIGFNYSGRDEIVRACRKMFNQLSRGDISPEDISERTFSNYLDTAGIPDPDLLIRTAGEMRVSNFLLWQIAYSEFWITETLWPDFTVKHLRKAISEYQKRYRKFGGL